MDMKSRVKSVIYCGVVGDVLGSQVEGFTRDYIVKRYPEGVKSFGENATPTDDTAMTDVTLRHLRKQMMSKSSIDDQRLILEYAEEAFRHPYGYSKSTRDLLRRYTINPNSTEKLNKDTNGCLMRVSPLVIHSLMFDEERMKLEISRCVSRTHDNDQARLVCLCFVMLLSSILREDETVPPLEKIKNAVMKIWHLIRQDPELLDKCETVILHGENLSYPSCLGFSISERLLGRNAFQIRAVDCFCVALFYSFYEDPKEAMIRCIGEGGDTDTTTKVLGEILGALHGDSWVPEEWRHEKAEELSRIAEEIVEKATQ